MQHVDRIIIGAGIYGLYAAVKSAEYGKSVLVLECGTDFFQRASYVNQARIHNGLHYPRSYETASKCQSYYKQFIEDHKNCINQDFDAIYAVSAKDSLVCAKEFEWLIGRLDIDCRLISPDRFFKKGSVEVAYMVKEPAFDYVLLKKHYSDLISYYKSLIQVKFDYLVDCIQYKDGEYVINGEYSSPFLLNTTYASTNQVASLLTDDLIKTKYELCEVILCDASPVYDYTGITVMDGGFFSLMPWGNSSLYTLTSVHHTPHCQHIGSVPKFDCMRTAKVCSDKNLADCNMCPYRPHTAFNHMMTTLDRFLIDSQTIKYKKSLFAVKALLSGTECDDSRPTVIKQYEEFPGFYSVLSGKISTIYELDEIIQK